MSEAAEIPVSRVEWKGAVRIIRSAFPPIDLFEDIADPADWPLLISAEQKTNPRIMATIGNLDLVPVGRRVGGNGASYLMAPLPMSAPIGQAGLPMAATACSMLGTGSRPRCSRRSTTMPASWHGLGKHLAGLRSSGKSSCPSMQNCMIFVLWQASRFRRSTPTPMPHLKRSRGTSRARDRMELSTRVSGIQMENASRSSTLTARQTPFRDGTSTIIGMASALTSSVMLELGLFSVSSICRPIPSDRIGWVSGRVL